MGGRGRRMGYVDKGQLIYRGRTFLNRIKDELLPLGLPCVISTADRENLTGEDGTIYVKDIPKLPDGSGAGPMGGIWSCFQKTGAEGFFTVSCDMPLFRREMFLALMDRVRCFGEPGTAGFSRCAVIIPELVFFLLQSLLGKEITR